MLPAYNTFKALQSKSEPDLTRYLCYWLIFALISCVDFLIDAIGAFFPFYYEAKLGLFLWLSLERTSGAMVIYSKMEPLLKAYEPEVDKAIASALSAARWRRSVCARSLAAASAASLTALVSSMRDLFASRRAWASTASVASFCSAASCSVRLAFLGSARSAGSSAAASFVATLHVSAQRVASRAPNGSRHSRHRPSKVPTHAAQKRWRHGSTTHSRKVFSHAGHVRLVRRFSRAASIDRRIAPAPAWRAWRA